MSIVFHMPGVFGLVLFEVQEDLRKQAGYTAGSDWFEETIQSSSSVGDAGTNGGVYWVSKNP